MAWTARLTIVGAIEEVGCGGTGCKGCPYSLSELDDLACSVLVPGEPLDLARQIASELSLEVPSLRSAENIGHDADVGRVYDVAELGLAAVALRDVARAFDGISDAEGRASERALRFNERMALDRAAELFERAQRYDKRVVLEI